MKKILTKDLLYLFVIAFISFSCSKSDDSVDPPVITAPSYLVSVDTFLTRTDSDLNTFLNGADLGSLGGQLKYTTTIYKIVYKTKYKGEEILASGLVILPVTEDEVDMMSFQHGTIGADSEAPSNITLQDPLAILYATIASSGFIGVIPDFIGFGASVAIPHPYYVEDLTASAIIDNMRAAKELAEYKGLNFSSDVYLAGYSQGGYATMATQKAMEESPVSGFNLKASFPSSGGYDVKGFQEYFFQQETYHQPFFMGYVVNGFRTAYDWQNPLTDIFNQPYADRIPDLYNGQNSGSDINGSLNDTLSVLLTAEILSDFETSEKYTTLKQQLIDNSLTDWTPSARTYMYHGDSDITVPFQNSVDTYNKLLANGTSESVLTFTPLPGGTHGASGFIQYLGFLIADVETVRSN